MDVAKLKRLPFLVGYQRRMDRNFRSLKKQARPSQRSSAA
jgi:hypothetical protein